MARPQPPSTYSQWPYLNPRRISCMRRHGHFDPFGHHDSISRPCGSRRRGRLHAHAVLHSTQRRASLLFQRPADGGLSGISRSSPPQLASPSVTRLLPPICAQAPPSVMINPSGGPETPRARCHDHSH
ncbi:hypothetical protein PYCCODRAFT_139404 [Trametes coccinea BRFM310]|uniref:Uncharacterized protein n=1 Tax=Trametes coccinea (strain BRFM310) TaxID=1353009 RepID=A0A1Y2IT00_TRAC3|nr:hypothetical protein PYCCODRAFT_139404 [Trametes coccinea BRFM310]